MPNFLLLWICSLRKYELFFSYHVIKRSVFCRYYNRCFISHDVKFRISLFNGVTDEHDEATMKTDEAVYFYPVN